MILTRTMLLYALALGILAWQFTHNASQAVQHAQQARWQAAEEASNPY